MTQPLVSIIVPVYNSETYLGECIQSLLVQTIQDIEVIIINDGSTDLSLEVAIKYSSLDDRIKVMSQKNKGVSSARNYGLSVAQGKYVAFVDSDDYIDRNLYEYLYNIAENYHLDLVISNFEQENAGRKIIDTLDIKSDILIKKEEIVTEIMPQFLSHEKLNTVCNKLYRRLIIESFNIQFPVNVSLGEDRLFNIKYFSNIESLVYTHYCGYYYREVEGSATRNILEKDYFNRALEIYNEELPFNYYATMTQIDVKKLQTQKFINNVISYSYIYSHPNLGMNFNTRYQYLKKMINHPDVKKGIKIYVENFYSDKSLYEKLIVKFIKLRCVFGIQCLTAYSRFRCKWESEL